MLPWSDPQVSSNTRMPFKLVFDSEWNFVVLNILLYGWVLFPSRKIGRRSCRGIRPLFRDVLSLSEEDDILGMDFGREFFVSIPVLPAAGPQLAFDQDLFSLR